MNTTNNVSTIALDYLSADFGVLACREQLQVDVTNHLSAAGYNGSYNGAMGLF